MKSRTTAAQWTGLAVSAALLAVVLAWRQHDVRTVVAGDAELDLLRTERQRLSRFTPAVVQAARGSVEALEGLAAMPASWRPDWSAEALPPAAGSSQQKWRLTPRRSPTWSELLADVSTLAAAPGNRIASLEVRSRGTLTEREIASVEIIVEQTIPTPSRRQPPGGTGSSGAEVPAAPPAVGAGPSLRRPVASAEPPAPGQASAPVRPDPRGPRAGFPSTQKPQPKQP